MNLNRLWETAAGIPYPDSVKLLGPFNTHTHPRDTDLEKDGRAEMHVPLLAEVFEDANCMGNTVPPLTTPDLARAKGAQWRALVPVDRPLKLRIGGLVHEGASPRDVVWGYDKPSGEQSWHYMKMFIRAASNSNGADVSDVTKVIPVLKAMTDASAFRYQKQPMTLAVHAERKFAENGKRIMFLEREWESIQRDIEYILREVPGIKLVVCHVGDRRTIEQIRKWRKLGHNVWGELAPHYSVYTCDDLFEGPGGGTKMNAHIFCLPIFHTEEDRAAVEAAMLSGEPWWIFGSDDACWTDDPTQESGVKIDKNGFVTGGQTQIPEANVSFVIEKFIAAGLGEQELNRFLSLNGREAYGLSAPTTSIRFKREDWEVSLYIERTAPHRHLKARVAMGGATRRYRVAKISDR
jgi:dihydroorotase